MTTPAQRVRAYLDAREGFRKDHSGLDPELIHGLGTMGGVIPLTAADLKALLAAAEASPYRADRITDQNVADIVETAAYGGITYWASEPTQADFDAAPEGTVATIVEVDDVGRHVLHLTDDQIRTAVVEIAEGKHTNDTIRGYVRSAFDNWTEEDGIDCGEIDASAADCIVQVACFGELVYG